jgi:YD repeat-containing protein
MTAIIDANGNKTRFAINERGQQISRTLPLGQTEFFQYDNRNRQTLHVTFEGVHKRTLYDDSPMGGGRVLRYEWFANANDYSAMIASGSLESGVRWKQVTMSFDAMGRLTTTQHINAEGAVVRQSICNRIHGNLEDSLRRSRASGSGIDPVGGNRLRVRSHRPKGIDLGGFARWLDRHRRYGNRVPV